MSAGGHACGRQVSQPRRSKLRTCLKVQTKEKGSNSTTDTGFVELLRFTRTACNSMLTLTFLCPGSLHILQLEAACKHREATHCHSTDSLTTPEPQLLRLGRGIAASQQEIY